MRRRYRATDHRNPAGLRSDVLDGFAIVFHERTALDQITRRISADRKLWKQNEARASCLGPLGEINNLGGVAGEISARGINLPQRDLHPSSLRQNQRVCRDVLTL